LAGAIQAKPPAWPRAGHRVAIDPGQGAEDEAASDFN